MKPHNHKTGGIINALLSFDKYFKVNPHFKMYKQFHGYTDLLFNVSELSNIVQENAEKKYEHNFNPSKTDFEASFPFYFI